MVSTAASAVCLTGEGVRKQQSDVSQRNYKVSKCTKGFCDGPVLIRKQVASATFEVHRLNAVSKDILQANTNKAVNSQTAVSIRL